jgi:acyl-CoA thioesterase I
MDPLTGGGGSGYGQCVLTNHRRMHKESLFVYGTLKDGDIRRALFGGSPVGTNDFLDGYAKTSTAIAGVEYPNITPAADGCVSGEVLEVDGETLRRVDMYESETYARKRFVLHSGQRAWAYIRE